MMVRVFLRLTVANYAQWRVVYDEFDQERQQMGIVEETVHQDLDDPNSITVGLWPHYWGHEYEPGFAQPAYWSA
ncbi:MAG: hypothetical protein O2924_02955 [Chloroflexi bacterium]|nr:hypothetical protein [Chloroflexota bacterium]MQC25487.1 hypothetical protein [Chloroflexota bacterium]